MPSASMDKRSERNPPTNRNLFVINSFIDYFKIVYSMRTSMRSWSDLSMIIQFYFDYHLDQHLSLSYYFQLLSLLCYSSNPFFSTFYYYLSYLTDLMVLNSFLPPRTASFPCLQVIQHQLIDYQFSTLIQSTQPTNEWILIVYFYSLLKRQRLPLSPKYSLLQPYCNSVESKATLST